MILNLTVCVIDLTYFVLCITYVAEIFSVLRNIIPQSVDTFF